ncbi:selenoprotein S isoform X2 [Latimeria chalumnae]|uniref:selenoprotein S isoform X2 n=1 Tax=Latimeria chalumnae TaxID=7897 RepID=UPI0003C1AEE3|nr:PREDICTED: selenoprotein S isoform X2 [Latimeria chalumnae]|eukprot:XP_005990197.1 PREDICTED: selenoprotein S isoform X2 [Latimeria chalumnae]
MEAERGTGVVLDNKPELEQQGLEFLQQTVGNLFSDYGWYILFGCAAVLLFIQKFRGRMGALVQRRSDSSQVTVDPTLVVKQQEALEASRRRMQEELDAQAEKYKERQKQLDEEKRRQKIEMWESMQEGKSYKGNAKLSQETRESSSSAVPKSKPDKKPLRGGGYSPLSGDGGGTCSWRPGRRGPSSGG